MKNSKYQTQSKGESFQKEISESEGVSKRADTQVIVHIHNTQRKERVLCYVHHLIISSPHINRERKILYKESFLALLAIRGNVKKNKIFLTDKCQQVSASVRLVRRCRGSLRVICDSREMKAGLLIVLRKQKFSRRLIR